MAQEVERRDLALVLGGAKCVWDDLRELEEIVGGPWPGWVVAANDVATHDPRKLHPDIELWDGTVHAWCSLHPRKFKKWKAERERAGLPPVGSTWSHSYRSLCDNVLRERAAGSSGLFAVCVSRDRLGAEAIVCAGTPMTKMAHFDESREHQKDDAWTRAKHHFPRWEERKENGELDSVRSLSGRTRKLLGAPDAGFLRLKG